MAEIFVSYTSSDRDWANWVGLELERLGHVARVHEWEISAGGNIPAWMEERHQKADHVLFVISKLLSDEGLFELGASGRRVGGSEQEAGFRLAGFHRGVPDANAVGAVQTVRPVRTARGGRTGAAFRIFDAGKEANVSVVSGRENFCSRENPDNSLSRRSVRPLEYSDRCSSPLPRPRRRAHCDRRGADALRGPGRDHGAARPARRR